MELTHFQVMAFQFKIDHEGNQYLYDYTIGTNEVNCYGCESNKTGKLLKSFAVPDEVADVAERYCYKMDLYILNNQYKLDIKEIEQLFNDEALQPIQS